jgi:hypothetical protein
MVTGLTVTIVGSHSIATGDFILIKHDDSDNLATSSLTDWKAKVLEVRALDAEHVYIRVSWLNRPEDLMGGRQIFHGRSELIPTNQMDVMSALSVNGIFSLKHWDEFEDDTQENFFEEDEYFWRQTFDFVSNRLSVSQKQFSRDQAGFSDQLIGPRWKYASIIRHEPC